MAPAGHTDLARALELTEDEQSAVKLAAHVALARQDLLGFNTLIDPSYVTPPHLVRLCSLLMEVERFVSTKGQEGVGRAMIIMPPRHGKSETCSGKFPSWFLGRDPSRKVIMTTYGATLAQTFSIQNRDTIAVNPFYPLVFPEATLSTKVKAADKWAIHGQRESMVAAGIGGPITGFGAHLLLIDDPVKDFEEANSPAYQVKVHQWYKTTSRTRLAIGGAIILIMTHWAEADLVGKILDSEEAEDFFVLHLPALSYGSPSDYPVDDPEAQKQLQWIVEKAPAAMPDPLGRPKGAPLWPEMGFDTKFMKSAQTVMQRDFHGLYQGVPGAPEGERFDKGTFRPVVQGQLEEQGYQKVAAVRSWDLAWSESEVADYTVGLKISLWAPVKPLKDQPPFKILLEDVVRWQEEWDKSHEDIIEVALKDSESYHLLVEAVAAQSVAFKSLRRDPRMWKHTITKHVPQKDKEVRAKQGIRLAGHGFVYILYPNASTAPSWERTFLRELGLFPHASNDDQVDAYTQAINRWSPMIDSLLARSNAFVKLAAEPRAPALLRVLPHEFRDERAEQATNKDGLVWQRRDAVFMQ